MKFVFSPILLFLSIFIVSSKHTETKTHTNKHANEASVFAANCGDTSIGTPTPPCNSTAGCLGGQSFEDFNRNGRNDIHEYGVAGIEVHLFDGRGNPVGMTITDADGDWQVCNLTDGAPYRVEFRLPTSLSCWATPTQVGADGRSDVQIRTVPDCAYFGLSNAQDYCQENPTVYVPCFVNGEAGAGGTADGLDALVGFDYQSNGEPGSADYTGDPIHLAFLPEIGATWGMAYDRFERRIFTSAVLKRHSGFGPLGTGGIYVADLDISSTFGNYIDLQTLGVNTGADPRTPYDGLPLAANELPADADEPNWDVDAFAQIGKIGIGGMAISEDGQQLYLLNLHNKTLVMLDISS
ncbi:MAG: SdrD B-like domain-containing protein, partial [Bacteroidota bacterium]